jgi:endonuclease/exonuclease/phosphatase family metal-dependent hydrolase
MQSIRVTTYNVLANSMAIPQFIQVRDPHHLTMESRMPLILHELEIMICNHAIIALQEVDIALACGGINELFLKSNYEVLRAHYSTKPERDGFGNFLCIPNDLYKVVQYGQERIGAHIPTPSLLTDQVGNVFVEAQKRDNVMLYARLESRQSGFQFYVFCWHMPCAFWWLPVMALHADALKYRISRIVKATAFILLGDFNTVPGTPLYDFICDTEQKTPNISPCAGWNPLCDDLRLRDARQDVCGIAALVTNRARNSSGKLFQGCLDHIFYAGAALVPVAYNLHKLTSEHELPNACHGSDHVPVSCTFEIAELSSR